MKNYYSHYVKKTIYIFIFLLLVVFVLSIYNLIVLNLGSEFNTRDYLEIKKIEYENIYEISFYSILFLFILLVTYIVKYKIVKHKKQINKVKKKVVRAIEFEKEKEMLIPVTTKDTIKNEKKNKSVYYRGILLLKKRY